MAIQQISVTNRVATHLKKGGFVVCGNTDYLVEFLFDSEWKGYEEKTARFVWNDKYQDVKFTGNTCPLPAVHRTDFVSVGVYAGDLCTTTPAVIPCQRSILCGSDTPHAENEANYASEAQLAAEAAQEAANEAKRAAGEAAGEAVASFAEQSAAQLLGGIVQTTGGSETNVMSQKAVTKELSNIYKGALKGTASGEAVTIDDISPAEHELGVKVSSKNLIPFNYTTYSNNYGINFTVNADGSITMDGNSKGSTYHIIEIAKPIRVDAGIYTISASATLPDGVNLWLRVVKNGEVTGTVSNKTITFTEPTDICCYISVKTGTTLNNLTLYPQIEKGAVATGYVPYVDVSTVKLLVQGYDVEPIDYTVNQDGSVDGVKSIYPSTILSTDTDNTVIDVEYNRDINKAFAELQQAIISLGGNI